MKIRLRLCVPVLFGLAVASPLPAAAPVAASPKIQLRIDALLKRRLNPEPLPVTLPNPFQQTGVVTREVAGTERPGSPSLGDNPTNASLAPSSVEILSAIASRLKIGGIIVLKDRLQAVVNGVPRREGDSIAADWNGTLLYAKIARLSPGEIVLRYADAEVTLKF